MATPTRPMTDRQRLIDLLLQQKVGLTFEEFVAARRTAGRSRRRIAHELSEATGEYVPSQTLDNWLAE